MLSMHLPWQLLGPILAVSFGLVAWPAVAAVSEPNGVMVPGPPNTDTELLLQEFFDMQGEAIDAIAEATTEPGVFSPLCDFEAALVLSESQAAAGISWYNVAVDEPPAPEPLSAPDQLFEIVPEGSDIGALISSADIRTDPGYAGGLIGFALIKQGQPVYYSEYRRNAFCSECDSPGFWKMALVFPSTTQDNTYYIAFEDWEGANDQTWHGNDGDFNDKVFRITGVSCPGGGESCDTGLPGLCAPGVTQCQVGGAIECLPQLEAVNERCDGLDNDCDGSVDEGELCAPDERCRHGSCVPRCGEVVWTCEDDEICNTEGFCVDAACADVDCPSGELCVDGQCRAPCADVVCPAPLLCLAGRCSDPCAGVVCDEGRVCERGVCVMGCECSSCTAGRECADTGVCVDPGCADRTCDAGHACVLGECVDACLGSRCPLGERCSMGECVDACTGVECDAGQKCLVGACADSCSDVDCGPGFKCVPGEDDQGECVDGCQGVDCGEGRTCRNGACIGTGMVTCSAGQVAVGMDCVDACDGVSCPEGEQCRAGRCQAPCADIVCEASRVCRDGACVERCEGVQCPTGRECRAGVCGALVPDATGQSDGSQNAAPGSAGSSTSESSSAPAGDVATAEGGHDSDSGAQLPSVSTDEPLLAERLAPRLAPPAASGCDCRVEGTERAVGGVPWIIGALLLLRRRNRPRELN